MLSITESFKDLGLNSCIINVLNDIGYIKPLPIQAQCIPYLLSGKDVLGMAHTGSGKTAAFTLPLLHNINIDSSFSQGLIIAPTRELAIQIGKVCAYFAKYMKEINVVTLYGGQSYDIQLRALKKNPHIIIGTPGRLLDHLNRGTANLSKLKTLIIDEADEMLRMGFIEDVKKIITNIPNKHQTALFSATLPIDIRQISYQFMNNPKEIYIDSDTYACTNIKQTYWLVHGVSKHEALMRFLETEEFNAAIVFVRTKYATLKISEILGRFGYNSAALNGDMDQSIRHQTLNQLRNGQLDILIATDIAARGLDINRISLVINYDIPMNSDAYIHRIGRTGRSGNIGKSVLFVERSEYRVLRNIERAINLNISKIQCPTSTDLLDYRLNKFIDKVIEELNSSDLEIYRSLLLKIISQKHLTIEDVSVVLLKMAQGNRPLVFLKHQVIKSKLVNKKVDIQSYVYSRKGRKYHCNIYNNFDINNNNRLRSDKDINVINSYRISVGRADGIKVQHIIKALSKISNFNCQDIGNIRLFSSYSIIEIAKKLSSNVILLQLSNARILNKSINMQFLGSVPAHNKIRKHKLYLNQ